jgi:putative tryptophan/tyrosine transport system substrate-binding protein
MNVLAILTKNRSPKMLALLNPDNPNAHSYALQAQAAADALGLRLKVLTAHAEADLDNEAAFGIIVQRRAEALLVIAEPFFIARREQVVALAAGHALPAIYPTRWFPECGGLMS